MSTVTENQAKEEIAHKALRFLTAGSVDDGKSTLISRLLFDSRAILADQLDALEKRAAGAPIDLSLLTDGLEAEREQGITIDVAYRYFSTPKRKFIIADTPGHIQYTRNMVTGASTANLAIILVDARKGIIEQTYRHSYIASLLQIPHIIVCINKMDLVEWDEKTFNRIVNDYKAFASKLDIKDVHFLPISALAGDNVVNRSENMDWYQGPTLMYLLETIHIGSDLNHIDARFPVQYVIRPMKNEYHDFRGYAGRIAGGVFRVGDKVKALPSGFSSKIKSIVTMDGDLQEAFAPQSVTITLEDEIDISRGDMLVRENNMPQVEQEFDVMLCWMNEKKMVPRGKYILRHTSRECKCIVKETKYKLNINTLQRLEDDLELGLNDIGRVTIRTTVPLFFDSYRKNRNTGSIILVDESTNETVAAGMIV